jgi:hypothetical protein
MSTSKTLHFAGGGAAGYGSHKNPQFFISVSTAPCKATLKVECAAADALCFFVQRQRVAGERRLHRFGEEDSPDRAHTSKFVKGQEHEEEVTFDSTGLYVVLVMTHAPGIEGPVTLTLSVGGAGGAKLTGGAVYAPVTQAFLLDESAAYGSSKNPQLLLAVRERCTLDIELRMRSGASAVRFFVQRAPHGTRLADFRPGHEMPDTATSCTSYLLWTGAAALYVR